MPKVVPIRRSYENVHALLAAIAEEPGLVGFVGTMVLEDSTYVPIAHGTDLGDLAFAGAMLLRLSQEEEVDSDANRG